MGEDNSPFVNEGKNILIEEFGTDYVIYFSILTCIASGMKTSAEIKNELGIDNISSYLSRLEDYYGLVSKYQPIFAKANSKKVRYQLDDLPYSLVPLLLQVPGIGGEQGSESPWGHRQTGL